jgi:hypothetical protein
MTSHDTESTARARVAGGKGILAADETAHIDQALQRARNPIHRAEPMHVPGDAFHCTGGRRVHQRRHLARRDDPSEERQRDVAPEGALESRHFQRHQGRHQGEAVASAPGGSRSGSVRVWPITSREWSSRAGRSPPEGCESWRRSAVLPDRISSRTCRGSESALGQPRRRQTRPRPDLDHQRSVDGLPERLLDKGTRSAESQCSPGAGRHHHKPLDGPVGTR